MALALFAAGCSGGPDTQPLRVLAAASLTDALNDVAAAFTEAEGIDVELQFAGSQTLVTQLAEGIAGDVLATADEVSMASAAEQGLVGAPTIFAGNRIVLIVPAANEAGIEAPVDIERPGVRLVLGAEEVPIGRYAREAFDELGLTDFEANVVSEEEDVKGVVGKVVSGEADGGVVYATDAVDGVLSIPLDVDVVARYPVAVTESADHPDEAASFVEFLTSARGQELFADAGFIAP